jgi:RimJ/RimL family protein N-acetyltransferase
VNVASFRFEPLQESDLPMLCEWLARPHVAAWWQPTPTLEELRDDYFGPEPDPIQAFLGWQGGEPVGFIQSYVVMDSGGGWWPDETDPGARGIDQFLADGARLGQGLGSAMVRAFVQQLFADPAVTVIQTDPDPANERAIRCYRRAGFRDVGIFDTPNGAALLMRVAPEGFPRRAAVDFRHSPSS